MKIDSMYSCHIKDADKHIHHVLSDTVTLYRKAVDYLIDVCLKEWNCLKDILFAQQQQRMVEVLVHGTKTQSAQYPFASLFYKFPSYLRRSAITEAIGKVSSYQSNLANWEAMEPSSRGKRPGKPNAGFVYPCLYRKNLYNQTGIYEAMIKVWVRNTWDWITIRFRKSDADYIDHHCSSRKESAPVLRKRNRKWSLDFCYTEEAVLSKTDIFHQRILSVDLGLNNACVCTCMLSDGTILGREFLSLPREYDCLKRKTDRIRQAQRHGSRCVRNLWKLADGVNDAIAVKTARFIIDMAVLYQVDTIVFEHLDLSGNKHGSKKMRLHLWKARYVQQVVTDRAHRLGMHISHICAWGTSRLAFDGTGSVKRGGESEKTNGNYSLCEFTTGKIYHTDLNAAYNIGARYFVREILKTLPVTEGQRIMAKVPGCEKRSTCTLSTLISLNAELYASA